MTANTKQIQDKFAEIEAMLNNVDTFFDDLPGSRKGPETPKDFSQRESLQYPFINDF